MHHVTIHHEPGHYAGWPANYGMWNWGDQIVVAYTVGRFKPRLHFHAVDPARPLINTQSRSTDGGNTWTAEPFPGKTPGDRGLSADEHMIPQLHLSQAIAHDPPTPCTSPTDFTHPDFALMCARTGLDVGAVAFFYTSTDRCRSWQGPFALPNHNHLGIAARTDYLIDSPTALTMFLTARTNAESEGRVICVQTEDGGRTFKQISNVGPEPDPPGFAIMPSSVRLPTGLLLTAVRRRDADNHDWIDLHRSDDRGQTWSPLQPPVTHTGRGGNPPALTLLRDRRLCLTYAHRDAPFSICAKLSEDHGQTWSPPITLRDHAGCHDIGYPRTVQRPDGSIVTAYYWNDAPNSERYLAATIWEA